MTRQVGFVVAAIAVILAAPAQGQDVPLSGLLLQFFSPSNPVILDNPFHGAHFGSAPEAQATLALLNRGLRSGASQLTSFPLGSSSGGFTFTLDPTLGIFERHAASFGP